MPFERVHDIDWIACKNKSCVVGREGSRFQLSNVESVELLFPSVEMFDDGAWIADPFGTTTCEIWYEPRGRGFSRYIRAKKRIKCPGGVTFRKPEEPVEYLETEEMMRFFGVEEISCEDATPEDLAKRGHKLLSCKVKGGGKESEVGEVRWLTIGALSESSYKATPLKITAKFQEPTDCMYMRRPGSAFGYDLVCITDAEAADELTEVERTLRTIRFK